MDKICARCGFKMHEDDFLCPECGAIFGEPVYVPPRREAPKTDETQPQKQKKWFIAIPIAITVVLVALLLLDPFSVDQHGSDVPSGSSAISASPQESSSGSIPEIPASTFSVTVVDGAGKPLQGIDVTLRYADITVTTDENGVALFVVTKLMASNNWFVSLSNVPAGFYYQSEYSFPVAEKCQLITLYCSEGDPLPDNIEYTVKVVDENNDPVKDVAVYFGAITPLSSAVNDVTAITDSSGEVKVEIYEDLSVYVTILFVPNGYSNATVNQILYFAKGSREMTITLTKEELGSSYYMLRLIDQNGDPVAFAEVCLALPDLGYQCNGMTNMDGYFWALITMDGCCAVIKKLPYPYGFQELGERLYFGEDRNMTIVVQHNDIIILE